MNTVCPRCGEPIRVNVVSQRAECIVCPWPSVLGGLGRRKKVDYIEKNPALLDALNDPAWDDTEEDE